MMLLPVVLPHRSAQHSARAEIALPSPTVPTSLAKAARTLEPRPASSANAVAYATSGALLSTVALAMRASSSWRPLQYGQVLTEFIVTMIDSIVDGESARGPAYAPR